MNNIERSLAGDIVATVRRTDRYNAALPYKGEPMDAVELVESKLRSHNQGAVSALERIRDWELDPMDDAEYVWDELRKIAAEVVGPRTPGGQ